MAEILQLKLNKKIISETFKISQVTIMKTYRKIHPYRKVVISNSATNKMLKIIKKDILIETDSDDNNTIWNYLDKNSNINDSNDDTLYNNDTDDDELLIDNSKYKEDKVCNLINKYK